MRGRILHLTRNPPIKGRTGWNVKNNRRNPVALKPVNLAQKLTLIQEHWSPRIVAALNGQHVKVAKLLGEFIWHSHQNEDELFLVLDGTLRLELRDGAMTLGPGELCVVPRGVEHRPVAQEEVHVVLFEPASTVNTGDLRNERTVESPDWI
jgi:mannose-6-phosphate isomerase-like protein (cupin superfamily)